MLLYVTDFQETVVEAPVKCAKCNGKGVLQEYKRIKNGVCFRCDGSGLSSKIETKTITKEITTPVTVRFLEDDQSFEDLLAQRESEHNEILNWFLNKD